MARFLLPLILFLVVKVDVGSAWSLEDFSLRGLMQKFGPKEKIPAEFQHEHVLQLNNSNFEEQVSLEDWCCKNAVGSLYLLHEISSKEEPLK